MITLFCNLPPVNHSPGNITQCTTTYNDFQDREKISGNVGKGKLQYSARTEFLCKAFGQT